MQFSRIGLRPLGAQLTQPGKPVSSRVFLTRSTTCQVPPSKLHGPLSTILLRGQPAFARRKDAVMEGAKEEQSTVDPYDASSIQFHDADGVVSRTLDCAQKPHSNARGNFACFTCGLLHGSNIRFCWPDGLSL
eukprot:1161824-Pelagomonas_calceolata.AAC.2